MSETTIPGKKKEHEIFLFALSTCGWCKKVKRLLDDLEVEYTYVDVDLTKGEERERTKEELKKYNERMSYPTVIVDGKEVIVGFKDEKLREVLGD